MVLIKKLSSKLILKIQNLSCVVQADSVLHPQSPGSI